MNSLVKLEKRDFIPNKLLITCLKIRESERSSFVTRDLLFIEVRSNVLLLYFFISLTLDSNYRNLILQISNDPCLTLSKIVSN